MSFPKNNLLIVSNIVITCIILASSVQCMAWNKIVDNGDSGYSETTQNWATYPGFGYGGTYRYLSRLEGDHSKTGTATWQTKAPLCGIYKVSVAFRKTENRTSDADYYVIKYSGAKDHFSLNQQGSSMGPTWVTLGKGYYYGKGDTMKVVLDGTDDAQSDCADAAQWELVEWRKCPPTAEELAARAASASAARSLLLAPIAPITPVAPVQ